MIEGQEKRASPRRTPRTTKEERVSPEMNADKQDNAKILPQEKIKKTAEFDGDEQSADDADFADYKDLGLKRRRKSTGVQGADGAGT
jgi:hypothetical protein